VITESEEEEEDTEVAVLEQEKLRKMTPQGYVDTTLLPFPRRIKKPTVDEQFGKFIEVIKKRSVNIPFLEAMQVPTYAKYLKDILNNKRPLRTTDMVKLTEECSMTILKKKDPRCPTINCSIGAEHFENALCDLEASISVMPKVVFDKLNYTSLSPTTMCLQLADQSVRYPAGDSRGHSGESPGFLRTRGFRRPRHGCRYKDASNPLETFLEHRQCQHQYRSWGNLPQHQQRGSTIHL
jgi:hypothetical protein